MGGIVIFLAILALIDGDLTYGDFNKLVIIGLILWIAIKD